MLRYFRTIRQKFLSENKFSKYTIYAVGEIILVVIGILIALQINNWNENRKKRNNEQQYLLALKEEFSFNRDELKRVITQNYLNYDNSKKILRNTGFETYKITEEAFGKLLTGSLSTETRFDPNQGVISEIINSGKLTIFSSEK